MVKRFEESSAAAMVRAIEGATGQGLADSERQRLIRGPDEEDLVNACRYPPDRRDQWPSRRNNAMLRIKRTYDPPERGDGQRILVERLWPRGMTKEALAAHAWMKEVAPSTKLRKWFDHRVERWEEFRRRYREELKAKRSTWEPILDAERRGKVTLLFSAHDVLHNGAVVLRDYLVERRPGSLRGKRAGHRLTSRTTGAKKFATTRAHMSPRTPSR
jgi:uncharacterized protein YeaO (DUF488 family)